MEFLRRPRIRPRGSRGGRGGQVIPNVPNTDWLEVYYDAKNYSGSGDVQDLVPMLLTEHHGSLIIHDGNQKFDLMVDYIE